MIKINCKICGKEKNTYKSRINSGRGVFCSKECFWKSQKGKKPWNTGKKCPTLSASKLGDKNPMWGGGYDKKKSNKEYRIKNKERLKELSKIYWIKKTGNESEEERKERLRIVGIWAKNNPDKRNASWNKRRVRILNFGGSFTGVEWEEIKKFQEYKCLGCGKKEPEIKLTIDHKISINKWDEWVTKNKVNYKCGDKENIQGLCRSCNSKKGTS